MRQPRLGRNDPVGGLAGASGDGCVEGSPAVRHDPRVLAWAAFGQARLPGRSVCRSRRSRCFPGRASWSSFRPIEFRETGPSVRPTVARKRERAIGANTDKDTHSWGSGVADAERARTEAHEKGGVSTFEKPVGSRRGAASCVDHRREVSSRSGHVIQDACPDLVERLVPALPLGHRRTRLRWPWRPPGPPCMPATCQSN